MASQLKSRKRVAGALGLACCAGILLAYHHLLAAKADPNAPVAQRDAVGQDAAPIRYGRDIRPLLSERCFKCHGRDAKARMAHLRLDVSEEALAKRDGIIPIVPGHPESSELWRRVTSADLKDRMPPLDSNKKPLSDEERELVRRWITQGAVYEPHWAFVPPVRPAVPEVHHAAWGRNAIDRFVLEGLERRSMEPSPEAGREALIRRLFLDLTGLPPKPDEIDAFVRDARPDAYEQWVDKLLTQEPYRTRYAERMAVPWLDAARYADTCGIHMDAGRQMWLWRDWVLNAFRDNMRFDRFVTEQIAGDLLPAATEQQKIASGFNRNHVTTDEGGAINEEYLVEYAVDRTSTTASVFMGLTLGCARCHEHKFDPISQEEFYRIYSFFNSNEEPGLYSQSQNSNRALEPFLIVATPQQKAELAALREKVARVTAEIDAPQFQDDARRQSFILDAQKKAGLVWEPTTVTGAASVYGAMLAVQPDGSVLASGNNPARDEHHITLRASGTDLRLLMLEALTHPKLPENRVGRAPNGNAVLTSVDAEARSIADPSRTAPVRFVWAWADFAQENGDYGVVNVLDDWDERGWAVDGEGRKGGRVALLLADKPFGFEGGTEVRVRLRYDSVYPQHILGHVRLTLARFAERGLDLLPAAVSGWYQAGPFKAASGEEAYKTAFGPEQDAAIQPGRTFGPGKLAWKYDVKLKDEQVNSLPADGMNASYFAKRVVLPSPRKLELSLGSDDGFALFVNGKQVAAREVDRGAAPDQDKIPVELPGGASTVVLKIVNTGGPGGFYYRAPARPDELVGELVAALVPESARSRELQGRLNAAWRLAYSPGYREQKNLVETSQKRISQLEAQVPQTMVMKELPAPRETFVLVRGQYDKPDKKHPVSRGIPAALGKLPEKAPLNRLGLAEWMTAPENPLVARIAVNRMWEMLFGTGLVRTTEDFGLQGEWPSHPELLDWLAVEFRESGWDVQHMLRLMLTSSTYRQSSTVRPALREHDPDNRLLAYFPRRRLGAEMVRDQALYISGLLVEKLGGPSVKPYQPDGLWQEVAMTSSNTRFYERGSGSDLWRRSLYTYWKRACPPPSLLMFDAPTRESCTIRRSSTNTPLQALVLWNDEQYVEAARVLATRTLHESADGSPARVVSAPVSAEPAGAAEGAGPASAQPVLTGLKPTVSKLDRERLTRLFRWCTGRTPEPAELTRIGDALNEFRERYRQKPEDAAKLLKVGVTPVPKDIDAAELAAWTMIANALMNLSATITQQ